jgi:hypothetical protein
MACTSVRNNNGGATCNMMLAAPGGHPLLAIPCR